MEINSLRKDRTLQIGKKRFVFPHIGLRIIKSAVAILLCYLVSFLRGNSGLVFYSELAALWCVQVYVSNTFKFATQRFIGTCVGAVYGLVYLLIYFRLTAVYQLSEPVLSYMDAIGISIFIVITLYTTVLMKKKDASYFSCVVFLSIVVNHVGDVNPYLFVWNRFLDTVIGIVIGVCVNVFRLPRKQRRDVLFISGLDDILLNGNEQLSDYNRIELNRMLDQGANFTISTMRTPASLMEPMKEIRLKLPVIAMDGAVLFDIAIKQYLKVYVISKEKSQMVFRIIREAGLQCFSNVIIDDMLVIYYEETEDEVRKDLICSMRKSPYRNYVKRPLPPDEEVVYFMLLDRSEVIEEFYNILIRKGITRDLKVLKYPSNDYEGYSYIKIYNKNASKENMIEYLKKQIGVEKTVTFGSVPGKYDILIADGDTNQMVNRLRKEYEPLNSIFL